MKFLSAKDFIPDIINPLGGTWPQPKRESIIMDYTYAVMQMRDFNRLYEYSTSQPSGAYEGKMWKSHLKSGWFLRWFGPCHVKGKKQTHVSTYYREIIIADGSRLT